MTHRPHDERKEPYHAPTMEVWQRLHDALSRLGHEIIAPVRPLIVRVLDALTEVLQRLGIYR